MVCFRFLSVHANIFPLVSKLATFVNILAKYVFARSYYGNKMAHFVSARKPITIVVIMFPIMSPMISVTDHLRKSESDEYVLAFSHRAALKYGRGNIFVTFAPLYFPLLEEISYKGLENCSN